MSKVIVTQSLEGKIQEFTFEGCGIEHGTTFLTVCRKGNTVAVFSHFENARVIDDAKASYDVKSSGDNDMTKWFKEHIKQTSKQFYPPIVK